MPIHRNDSERAQVLAYCESLVKELREQDFHDGKVRVEIDTRDIRGGEKMWGWIKKGIPIRLEVGKRELEEGAVFMGRRDQSARDRRAVPRAECVATIADQLQEMQDVGKFSGSIG